MQSTTQQLILKGNSEHKQIKLMLGKGASAIILHYFYSQVNFVLAQQRGDHPPAFTEEI